MFNYDKLLVTLTAIPFKSVEVDAAVEVAFGTLSVDVSEMWIYLVGISRARAAIY